MDRKGGKKSSKGARGLSPTNKKHPPNEEGQILRKKRGSISPGGECG